MVSAPVFTCLFSVCGCLQDQRGTVQGDAYGQINIIDQANKNAAGKSLCHEDNDGRMMGHINKTAGTYQPSKLVSYFFRVCYIWDEKA